MKIWESFSNQTCEISRLLKKKEYSTVVHT